jgi:general secretion pathway protein L
MSHRLLLAIDEQWPTRPDCPWVLLGPDGQPTAEGHSEPPLARRRRMRVVLTGPQCLWLESAAARAKRSDLPRLLAYALEDRLLKDPDTQHLTVSHRRPAGDGERELTGVLVVARERLRQVTAQLAAIGRPRRVLAEVQTARPASDAGISAVGRRRDPAQQREAGIALDADILAPLLAAQAATARANTAPSRRAAPRPRLPEPRPRALQAETALDVRPARYLWWQGAAGKAANLLHGEFAFREQGGGWLGRLAPAAWVGGAALALWFVVGVGEVLWLKHQQGGIEARIERVYRSSFPNSPVVAPAAQMRQQLNLERARHGLLRDDDALALLAQAAEALGTDAAGGWPPCASRTAGSTHPERPAAARAEAVVGLAARGLLADLRRDGATTHLLLRRETLQ